MKEWEIPQLPEWGEVNKPKAVDRTSCAILDRELATRGVRLPAMPYTVADITGAPARSIS